MLEELRALVEAEQLRMSAIPKVFELHEIDDALAVRSVARLRFNFWLTGCQGVQRRCVVWVQASATSRTVGKIAIRCAGEPAAL